VTFEIVNPRSLGAPRGWNHGMLVPREGRLLFIAGQVGVGDAMDSESPDAPGFVAQFAAALDRVLAVVREAGGGPADVGRMTVYVTDLAAYRASRGALGEAWRARFGTHYPAMTLVEVSGLVDRGAQVEIEATAVVPGARP
jgi:enamine deaminase RidA (YjgF/YER057c/UK114 family)